MAFLMFERTIGSGGVRVLRPTGESFSLAGFNLIYRAWRNCGQPINKGWQVSADELIKLYSEGFQTYDTRRLLIDYAPNSRRRIGVIELLDVHAYTWGTDGRAVWTPLMLRLQDVYEEEYDHEITDREKSEAMRELREPESSSDFVEFLYLNAPNWNWGMAGPTNAAFIHGEARAYFRKFF